MKSLAAAELRAECVKVREVDTNGFEAQLASSAFKVGQLSAYLEVDSAAGRLFDAAITRSGPFNPTGTVELIRLNVLKGMAEPRVPGLTAEVLKHVGVKEFEDAPPLEPVLPVEPAVPEVYVEPPPPSTPFVGFQLRPRGRRTPPADE